MPRLSNEDDLDAIGHEVYGEPPAASQEETMRRARSFEVLLARLRRRGKRQMRPAPLLEHIDEEEVR